MTTDARDALARRLCDTGDATFSALKHTVWLHHHHEKEPGRLYWLAVADAVLAWLSETPQIEVMARAQHRHETNDIMTTAAQNEEFLLHRDYWMEAARAAIAALKEPRT